MHFSGLWHFMLHATLLITLLPSRLELSTMHRVNSGLSFDFMISIYALHQQYFLRAALLLHVHRSARAIRVGASGGTANELAYTLLARGGHFLLCGQHR